MRVSIEEAKAFTRRVLRWPKIQEADLEDIASQAYLAYLRGFQRTGNDDPASFHRDIIDVWRSYTGIRNKHHVARLVTNWAYLARRQSDGAEHEMWWDAFPSTWTTGGEKITDALLDNSHHAYIVMEAHNKEGHS